LTANLEKGISAPCALVKVSAPKGPLLDCGRYGRRSKKLTGWRSKEKMLFLGGVVSKRTEKEIELYKELFNKAISVSILIGAGTIALWHKEGVNAWTVAGAIAFF